MNNLFKYLPAFSADYSGAMNAAERMNCLRILHGQGGCSGGVFSCDDWDVASSDEKGYFTKISEIDTITGNDEKMLQKIERTAEAVKSEFILICGSPIPMLIGTDFRAWKGKLERRLKIPVVTVDTLGFETYDVGEKMFYCALIDKFGERMNKKSTVNVIGDTPLNGWTPTIRKLLKNEILKKYDDVTFWYTDANIDSLKSMGMAALNIAVSASAIPAVKLLNEKFGTPYKLGFKVYEKNPDDSCITTKVNLRGQRILLCGEQLMMNAVREYLRSKCFANNVDVASFFTVEQGIAEKSDHKLDGEDDYRVLVKSESYDLIMGDPALEAIGGFNRSFIQWPHLAVGGKYLIEALPELSSEGIYEKFKRAIQ